jgi:hypothetical protein
MDARTQRGDLVVELGTGCEHQRVPLERAQSAPFHEVRQPVPADTRRRLTGRLPDVGGQRRAHRVEAAGQRQLRGGHDRSTVGLS